MLLGNTIKFTHVTLGLRPKTFDSIEVISLVCKQFGMVDPEVLEIRYIQHVISSPAVRIDNAVWHDFTLQNGE